MHLQISLRQAGGESMAETFDAVLIGAGHNTLAAALHLAAKGWRVGVFEQAPSRAARSRQGEYTLPGFRHDWAAMNLSLFAGSPFFKAYGAELAKHGCDFVPRQPPLRLLLPRWHMGGRVHRHGRNAGCLPRPVTPRCRNMGIARSRFGDEAPHLFGLLGSPMNFRALAYFIFKTLRAKGSAGTMDFTRFLLSSPRAWLEDTFEHPHLRALLAAWGMHLDFAPDVAGGAMFPYLEGMAGQAFGMVIGQGGADTS
jgi:phytoene dehydrogenase-like protein